MARNILLACLVVSLAGIVLCSPLELNYDLRHESLEKVPPEILALLLPLQPVNETFSVGKRTPVQADTCNCGIKGTTRIVGGKYAGVTEWPWQAYLLIDDEFMCGGSIVSENWIVTAAHCVTANSKVTIYLGINNLKDPKKAKHITTPSSIIVHEDYLKSNTSILNDIALLQLTTPVPRFSAAIKPICLPYKFPTRDFQMQDVTVTGWGRTSEEGDSSNRLKETTLTVLNQEQCTSKPYLLTTAYVTENMFCTYKKGTDSCQGDSGGPVNWQATATSRVYLIGVISFGSGCAKKNLPGVYTKVNNYLQWIDDNAGESFCNR